MATQRTTARKTTGTTKKAASNVPENGSNTPAKKRSDLVCKTGNVGENPELRFTPGGKAVCNFDIAVNFKVNDEVTVTEWYRITAWEQLAENVCASVEKGMRVMCFGVPSVEEFERNDGSMGKQKKINAWNVGIELSYGTAEFSKITRDSERYENQEDPF